MVLLVLAACGRLRFEERTDAAALPIDARTFDLDAGECPPAYTFVDGSCYRAESVAVMTWDAAEADCEADAVGAHLVVIADAAEANTIDPLMSVLVVDHWIGVTSRNNPVLNDVTGAPLTYTMWAPSEPDGQGCVEFNDNRTIDEQDCTVMSEYMCEYDGRPVMR